MQNLEYYNLFVAADNKQYAELLKESLETSFEENVIVEACVSKEECLNKMRNDSKPDIILLDYKLNRSNAGRNTHMVDKIKEMSPETVVIMMSNEEDMFSAMKALRYGAHDYVMKDKFVFSHIKASVKKCLQPSKQ